MRVTAVASSHFDKVGGTEQPEEPRSVTWQDSSSADNRHRLTMGARPDSDAQTPAADRFPIDITDTVREGIDRLLPRLWRFCLVLAGERSAADDLTQAACLRALEREDQFQLGTRLDRWTFRIAQTIWFNQRRAEKIRRGAGVVPAEDAGLVDPAANAEANLYLAEVLSAVMALPEAQRIAVLLVYVEGYSYKEAAEHLEIPIGTVMSRLAGARGRLSPLCDTIRRGKG
jgi:RNA polymerase sigma-70 factor (ECF subfamily)